MADLQEQARRVAAGSTEAFRGLVLATQDRYLRVTARILGSLADAEEALQEAYVRIFDALSAGKFDGRAKVETWMYRIVVHAGLDFLRARRRRSELPLASERSNQLVGRGLDGALAHVALRELTELLDHLPEEQRIVMVLKEFEGMSGGEVADVLGISEGAVEQRLVRARAQLRERMGDGQ